MSPALVGEGWPAIPYDPEADGVFLVVVNAGAHKYHLATKHIDLPAAHGLNTGGRVGFVGAITNEVQFSSQLDPFSRDSSNSTVSITALEDYLPMRKLRAAGVFSQDIQVDVYWIADGLGLALTQALHLVSGYMVDPVYDDVSGTVSFVVEDRGLEGELPFPPVVATVEGLDPQTLDSEHVGKVYPVIFGEVKKTPCLKLSDDFATWLVMDERFNELGDSQATQIYDGDTAVDIDTQGHLTDDDGNIYYYVDADTLPTSKDVTVDVTGYEPATVAEVVRRLFTHYVTDSNMLVDGTLSQLEIDFDRIDIGMIVNDRMPNAVEFMRDRVVRQLPAAMIQVGKKYKVQPLLWSRDATLTLSTDTNIVRTTSYPQETRRSAVFNDFVIRYGRTGLRGDYTGVVLRNPDTDAQCLRSSEFYGRRALGDFDAGDISSVDGAEFIADWLVATYGKMRVMVSYACTLEAIGANLWDTVRVVDRNQGWDHGPTFKVVSIGYSTGPLVELSLVSVDDYLQVHNRAYS